MTNTAKLYKLFVLNRIDEVDVELFTSLNCI